MRLVSMLPSATEIVYVLGLDTRGLSPREIDDYVRGRLAAGVDLYTLHEDALAELQPDLILTQDLCRVCALPSGQVEAALDYLGCRARVLALDPRSLEEVLDSILAVGQATGVPGRAGHLVAGLRARLAAVAARVAGRPRARVAVIEWVDPPFTAGHWVPDLVTAAGGMTVAACPGEPSVSVSWAEIAAAAPDLVVVAPCGYHLTGAAEQAASQRVRCPACPSGRSTPTASSSAPAPGWSPASRHSLRCCTPRTARHRPAGRLSQKVVAHTPPLVTPTAVPAHGGATSAAFHAAQVLPAVVAAARAGE
jgi:iron complex transport system substrate-binding protein